jgi:hypothetical protein
MAAPRRHIRRSPFHTLASTTVRLRRRLAAALVVTAAVVVLGGAIGTTAASAAQPPVGLGTAASFAVLAGSTVTNTGNSVISGDLGVSPGTAITGFPPGMVINGKIHSADAVALQAQTDLTTAYNDAKGRTPVTAVPADIGGMELVAGVYKASSALSLTGTVTLNAENDPDAVFIFQAPSTLITASSSTVSLLNGAQACNVFWQVGSSATLGTDTTFVGNILALTSASLTTGASVQGRVLARNGAVTLDDNVITRATCATPSTTTTTSAGLPTSTIAGGSTTTTAAGATTTTAAGATTTTAAGATTTTVAGATTTTAAGATTTTVAGATTTTVAGVTTTTAPGSTTTTAPGPPTTVPSPHTGEPWAGWPYWAIVAFAGLVGLAFVERAVRVRRRRA